MAMDWKVAFPLHPEYRTLPMVWYVPPLSPIQSAAEQGDIPLDNEMPDVRKLRIPLKYLANLLTAGDEQPVALGLERMLAMRSEEHTSELQSLMRISYAVFCLKKKKDNTQKHISVQTTPYITQIHKNDNS